MLAAAVTLIAACNEAVQPPAGPGPVATVTIRPLQPFVPVDTTIALSATATDSAGQIVPDVSFTWSSRDSTIASVDSLGVLRGNTFGAVSITATAQGKSGSAVVSVVLRWRAISAGGTYTCGITVTGVGYCWGNNVTAQLGIGAADFDQHPGPLKISTTERFTQVATGGTIAAHTCALTAAGAAWCWGSNVNGEVGTHDTARVLIPTPVTGGAAYTVLSVGNSHTCGLSQGQAFCWGDNSAGQLGAATGTDPLAIKTVSGGLVFTSISAGADFTCALTAALAAYCWGNNGQGQLGIGTTGSGTSTPVRAAPSLLLGAIAAGRGPNACGVLRPDQVYCWGENDVGQLGRGFASATEPAADGLAGAPSLVTVSVGLVHACALALGGAPSCWGGASYLGTASGAASSSPVSVEQIPALVSITAGTNHTCGLTADGTAYCWGRNDLGQLGTGTSSAVSLIPVKVADHP